MRGYHLLERGLDGLVYWRKPRAEAYSPSSCGGDHDVARLLGGGQARATAAMTPLVSNGCNGSPHVQSPPLDGSQVGEDKAAFLAAHV